MMRAAKIWGMSKMKKLVLVTLVLCFGLFLFAQENRATMTAPVIRAMPEGNVSFSAQFTGLVGSGDYRLGFGAGSGKVPGAKIELLKNGNAVSLPLTGFEQGYCSNWWNINKVSIQGFLLSGNAVPSKDEKLTLKVTVPKAELDKVKKVYLLIARKYGTDVWYIEDGAEMDEAYW